jgi:hypothetical protein
LGRQESAAVNRGSIANPDAMDWFVQRAATFASQNGLCTQA